MVQLSLMSHTLIAILAGGRAAAGSRLSRPCGDQGWPLHCSLLAHCLCRPAIASAHHTMEVEHTEHRSASSGLQFQLHPVSPGGAS
jgi:hypothetical protein